MSGFASRKLDDLKAEALAIKEQTRSFKTRNSLIETLDSTLEFPALKAKAEALPDASPAQRPHAVFDACTYRSARYSVVNGVFCHTAGLRGHYRGLYEAFRLSYPLEDTE